MTEMVEGVEKVVEEVEEKLPKESKLKEALESVDNQAKKAVKEAKQAEELVQKGPIAIFWDTESCPVPRGVRPEDIDGNIKMVLRAHPTINGPVTLFSAYGDFNAIPRQIGEGRRMANITRVELPNGRKDAVDRAISVDMFHFALDNQPPSFILLISGDFDWTPTLHTLSQRGYTIIIVIPSWVEVSSALRNVGSHIWDWSSVARGEGFVHGDKIAIPRPNEEEKATCTPSNV